MNNQPAPEGFIRLSSKWLETHSLPEDARLLSPHTGRWIEYLAYRGELIPESHRGFLIATARTDLPKEAYADDEIRPMTHDEHKALDEFTMAELRSEPGAEVASERAEAKAIRERAAFLTAHRACHSAEHDPANGKLHGYCVVCGVPFPCDFAKPQEESTITTLRSQLEAKDAELAMLQREMAGAIDNEQERWQDMLDRVFQMHVQNANIDGGGCESGDPLEFSESELHQAFQHLESQNDKLRAEVERLTIACEKEFASVQELNDQNTRLTAELDAVRKARDDYHNKACDIADQRDAAQARCGELELALRDLDTALAVMFWTSDDGMIQKLGEPDDAPDEKLGKAWAEARALLTPSQQLDTAHVVKDVTEKRVEELVSLLRRANKYVGASNRDLQEKIEDALTAAPTQEPLAPEGKATEGEG